MQILPTSLLPHLPLKRFRLLAGIRQWQIAQALRQSCAPSERSAAWVSLVERGIKTVTPDQALQLSEILAVPVTDLFPGGVGIAEDRRRRSKRLPDHTPDLFLPAHKDDKP